MTVRLNVVKAPVTPQVRTTKNAFKNQSRLLTDSTLRDILKLKMMHPDACEDDGYMTKHTLGGMGAGAAVGAAVGSVVPVVGTMFGGLVGGLVGAGTGATVGLVKYMMKKDSDNK